MCKKMQKMKGRVSVDGSWDIFCFEDCLSEEGLEVGFFPDELINNQYRFEDFLKDYMIIALEGFSDIIYSFYLNIVSGKEKLKLTFKYDAIMEKGLNYYNAVKRAMSLFNDMLIIPIETSFYFN